jgi:hypothetical protein
MLMTAPERNDRRWWPLLEIAVLATLAALLLGKGVIPGWRHLNTDFPNYYLVARLWREGYSLDRIYDWTWLQRVSDHWGLDQPLVGFAGLTPFSALPIAPLTIFSALTAKRIWIAINLALLAATVELMARSTTLTRRRIGIIALLAIMPLRTSFLFGQMHIAVLFLMALALFFHLRGRELRSGLAIALAAALKMYPLGFLVYFLWRRQWRAFAGTLAASVALLATSAAAMGWELQNIYLRQMLPRSLQGEVLDPYSIHAAAGAALFHRLFLFEPTLNPSPAFASPAAYTWIYPLWQLSILLPLLALLAPPSKRGAPSSGERQRETVGWAAFLFALLLLSPVPSTYHFVVMILPAVLLLDSLLREREKMLAATALALYLLASVADFLHLFFHSESTLGWILGISRLWFATALFGIFLLHLYRLRPQSTRDGQALRIVSLAGFAALVMTSGILGYRHHFHQREQEMSRRLSPPAKEFLTDLPLKDANGYAYLAMTLDGYRVIRPGSHADSARKTDQLSYTLSANNALFIEEADAHGSRIVRASDHAVVAEDAESPTISMDSKQLAFVRERRGRGSLWTVPLDSPRSPQRPTRITPDEYDVRQAAYLRTGTIVFLAHRDGESQLFTVIAGETPRPLLATGTEIASFAISPDEHRLLLAELIHNRWQLAVAELEPHRTTLLTSTDCNAYHPSWISATSAVYGSDCGRGVGLTALATISVP